jgi:hypothetical protein
MENKTPWWIVGILTTIILTGGTAWLSNVQNHVHTISEASYRQAERVTLLEHQVKETNARLSSIDHKMDKLIEAIQARK